MAAKANGGGTGKARTRPLATFSLSPQAIDALGRLADAWGLSKSASVELLIRQAAKREGITLRRPRRRGAEAG